MGQDIPWVPQDLRCAADPSTMCFKVNIGADVERRTNAKDVPRIRHVVKVTPQEEKLLQLKANATGVTIARLLADTALGTTPQVKNKVAVSELFALRRQIQGEATNLNQLTRDANGGTFFQTELLEAIAAVTALNERLDRWLTDNG